MKQRKDQSSNLPTNALTEEKILTNLKRFCTTEIEMTLKKIKTPTKHINTFSISLLTFMTSCYQNPKLKLNSRTFRALGLLNVLQNHQKRNKDFMKNSERIEPPKMKRHIKLVKTYLKLFEGNIFETIWKTFFRKECLTSSLLLIYTDLHKLCQYGFGQYLQDKSLKN